LHAGNTREEVERLAVVLKEWVRWEKKNKAEKEEEGEEVRAKL
jgi:hypothetical protein